MFRMVFKDMEYPDDLKKVGFHFMWQLMNCPASLHNPWWGSDGISPLRPAGQIVVTNSIEFRSYGFRNAKWIGFYRRFGN